MSKVYDNFTEGGYGFRLTPQLRDLMGLPTHIGDCYVLIVAKTKQAALQTAHQLGAEAVNTRDLRLATGTQMQRLQEIGVLSEGGIYYLASSGQPSRVVRVDALGAQVVARFEGGQFVAV